MRRTRNSFIHYGFTVGLGIGIAQTDEYFALPAPRSKPALPLLSVHVGYFYEFRARDDRS